MDMKTYLKQATPEQRESLAMAVDSSVGYLYLIGGGHRRASSTLCQKLVSAEKLLTLAELRPDIWSASDTGHIPKVAKRSRRSAAPP